MGGRFLITGTARSGTLYMATALKAAGINAGHEQVFTPGSVDPVTSPKWKAGEVSWLAAPFTPIDEMPVLHQVRHPLKVIGSLLRHGLVQPGEGSYTLYAYRHLPGLKALSSAIERAAYYWLHWNDLVTGAELTYRVEALDEALLDRICDLVGVEGDTARALSIPRDLNSIASPVPVDWADVPQPLRSQVQEAGIRYGYEAA